MSSAYIRTLLQVDSPPTELNPLSSPPASPTITRTTPKSKWHVAPPRVSLQFNKGGTGAYLGSSGGNRPEKRKPVVSKPRYIPAWEQHRRVQAITQMETRNNDFYHSQCEPTPLRRKDDF